MCRNRRNRGMRRLLSFLMLVSLIFICGNCLFPSESSCNLYQERPETLKEKTFFDSIKKTVSNISVVRINYEYRDTNFSEFTCDDLFNRDYCLTIVDNNEYFKDSSLLTKKSMGLIKSLYCRVIENDSVLVAIENFELEILNFKIRRKTKNEEGGFKIRFSKKEIEKLCGFKVINYGMGLIRIPVTKNENIKFEECIFKPVSETVTK